MMKNLLSLPLRLVFPAAPFSTKGGNYVPTFRNVVLDTETMSLEPTAAVISIGAINFDLHSGEIRDEFFINVLWQMDSEAGGKVDEATVNWWNEPRNSVAWSKTIPYAVPPTKAVDKFQAWLLKCCPNLYTKPNDYSIWAMGSEFDPPILNSFYLRTYSGKELPYPTLLPRQALADMRFLLKMFRGRVPKPPSVKHNALEDSKDQYDSIMQYRRLGIFNGLFNPLRNMP